MLESEFGKQQSGAEEGKGYGRRGSSSSVPKKKERPVLETVATDRRGENLPKVLHLKEPTASTIVVSP
jgi:hypothetical protein